VTESEFLPDAERESLAELCTSIARGAAAGDRGVLGLCEQACDLWPSDWVASPELLSRTARLAAREFGATLEAGSGLSTLVLGAVAETTGASIHSLEHDEDWFRVMTELTLGSQRVHLHRVPIVQYEEYDWYEVPAKLPDRFGLVLCDGPPSGTRGGRVGLVELRNRISGATVLLDDTHRPGEQRVLEAWGQFGATWKIRKPNMVRIYARKLREAHRRKSFAEIHIPSS
jgi:hypothetical protein